jgi:CheY-like chemotaxis protein
LAEKLRASKKDLRVVFASGYAEGEAMLDGTSAPWRFLEKPFTAEELKQALAL